MYITKPVAFSATLKLYEDWENTGSLSSMSSISTEMVTSSEYVPSEALKIDEIGRSVTYQNTGNFLNAFVHLRFLSIYAFTSLEQCNVIHKVKQ